MTIKTHDTCVPTHGRKSAFTISPVETHLALALIVTGVAVLAFGVLDDATAQVNSGAGINYNTERITNAVNAIMTYLEGSFGALIMASAGVGAIMSAAFGQYKASLSLLVVAVGSFILRSLMSTFFNDEGIQQ
jgi:hypothetical protein